MSVQSRTHPNGIEIYTLSFGEDEVAISAFGGQILSWTKRGIPIIFENRERAVMDGKTPYRGGAPICFPYFSKGTLLPLGTPLEPQHGRARTTLWEVSADDSAPSVTLRTSQPTSGAYGPTEFTCELVYTLSDRLDIRAAVRNIGEREAPFQLAVHTYWACADPSGAKVSGLETRYLDNLLGYAEGQDPDSSRPHQAPFDRVYPDALNKLNLETQRYNLEITTTGCAGTVLWNPGPNHTIADLGSPDFICVESGVVVPGKGLSPSGEHVVSISYRAELT
jgi:glucose-6-phosphate 1-epimerase